MNTDVRCSRDFQIEAVGAVLLRDIARFVKTANQFSSSVIVRRAQSSADGKSMLQMSGIHLKGGDRLSVTALGWDASECIEALARTTASWSLMPDHAIAA